MFRDEDELVKEQIRKILEVYEPEYIYGINELEEEDVIFYLYINGYLKLPEVSPL